MRQHEHPERTDADFGEVIHWKRFEQHREERMEADQHRQCHRERDEIGPFAYANGGNEEADQQQEQRHVDASEDGVVGQLRRVSEREQRPRLQVPRGPERRR